MESYEKLLERGMKKIPKEARDAGRFSIPRLQAFVMGPRTTVNNFSEIAGSLRRKPEHLLKFLLKELATSGETSGHKVVFQGKFSLDMINRKIELYVRDYVTCPECAKPDTKLTREKRLTFIVCEACGAKHVIKKV